MRALVLGSGGREHALVWKLMLDSAIELVLCAPGNAGIPDDFRRAVSVMEFKKIIDLVRTEKIDLVIVGPEAPLVAGITDVLNAAFQEMGLRVLVFGPSRLAACLEGSKIFTATRLNRLGLNRFQPRYNFGGHPKIIKKLLEEYPYLKVLKADGLAGGKGVYLPNTSQEIDAILHSLFVEKIFGRGGMRVLLQERLVGREYSCMVLCALKNGKPYVKPLPIVHDYKQLYEGGPNTGGAGALCDPNEDDHRVREEAIGRIIMPTLRHLVSIGTPFRGVLYAGLMQTEDGIKLIEYNVRFGDPEIQALVLMLHEFAPYLAATVTDTLHELPTIRVRPGASVVMTPLSGGYPGAYEVGYPISGIEEAQKHATVFHAGTEWKNGQCVTAGGRVLNVAAYDETRNGARQTVLRGMDAIGFHNMQSRNDIGAQGS